MPMSISFRASAEGQPGGTRSPSITVQEAQLHREGCHTGLLHSAEGDAVHDCALGDVFEWEFVLFSR